MHRLRAGRVRDPWPARVRTGRRCRPGRPCAWASKLGPDPARCWTPSPAWAREDDETSISGCSGSPRTIDAPSTPRRPSQASSVIRARRVRRSASPIPRRHSSTSAAWESGSVVPFLPCRDGWTTQRTPPAPGAVPAAGIGASVTWHGMPSPPRGRMTRTPSAVSPVRTASRSRLRPRRRDAMSTYANSGLRGRSLRSTPSNSAAAMFASRIAPSTSVVSRGTGRVASSRAVSSRSSRWAVAADSASASRRCDPLLDDVELLLCPAQVVGGEPGIRTGRVVHRRQRFHHLVDRLDQAQGPGGLGNHCAVGQHSGLRHGARLLADGRRAPSIMPRHASSGAGRERPIHVRSHSAERQAPVQSLRGRSAAPRRGDPAQAVVARPPPQQTFVLPGSLVFHEQTSPPLPFASRSQAVSEVLFQT